MSWSTGGGGASSGGTGLSEFQSNFLNRWVGSEETRQYTFDGSLGVLPSSFSMGSFKLSSGVQAVMYRLSDGRLAVGVVNRFNPQLGSISNPKFYALAPQTLLNVETKTDKTIDATSTPFTLQYSTAGDNLTYDFDFIPASAGTFKVEYFQGTDDTGVKIFDEVRVVTQAEVTAGLPVPFSVGNPYILAKSTPLFVRFSGISFKGGTNTPFGKDIPYFVSRILPYKEIQINGHVEFVRGDIPKIYIGCKYSVDTSETNSGVTITVDSNSPFRDVFTVYDGSSSFSIAKPCNVDFSSFTYPAGFIRGGVNVGGQSVGLAELRTKGDYVEFSFDADVGVWRFNNLRSDDSGVV